MSSEKDTCRFSVTLQILNGSVVVGEDGDGDFRWLHAVDTSATVSNIVDNNNRSEHW
ncbi:MAG: hypothetical protein V4695_00635 [Pseudomonadota bacterium]